ncbi:MAG: DUF4238 domain-containing protein [Acidobacteriota bacterium]
MGQHSLPQYYLRGFAPTGTKAIWRYEKGKPNPLSLQIKSAAQRKQLYGKVEAYLAQEIEGPANAILKKIENREAISDSEKLAFSRYVFVFWKRVEAAFERFKEKSPKVAHDEMQKLEACLRELEKQNPDKAERCEEIRKDGQRIYNDLAQNPTKQIWGKSIQYSNEQMPEVMSKMTWVFYTCTYPDIFITSDNPVFIHAIGIGKPHSDMSFPVTKEVALLATWRKGSNLRYREACPQQIRELNRRTAFNALRFAFASGNKAWITDLLNKPEHQVHLWVQQFPDKAR